MMTTSTGAGKAVTKVIPGLENKLTKRNWCNSSGSLAIMNFDLKNDTSVKMVNELIRKATLEALVNQIKYSMNTELVTLVILLVVRVRNQ